MNNEQVRNEGEKKIHNKESTTKILSTPHRTFALNSLWPQAGWSLRVKGQVCQEGQVGQIG